MASDRPCGAAAGRGRAPGRRRFPWQVLAAPLLAVVALVVACAGEPDPPGGPRNLLLIVLDTTRADHLASYGYGRETTPAIDALARRGVRFANAYAQSSLTPVSAASFLSGAYPYRTGVRSLFSVQEGRLTEEVPSLFEMLRRSGRRTAGFVGAKPMGSHYGLARGFDTFADDLSETARRHGIERFSEAPQRPADETTDLALDWLRAHGREPFAALVHYFDVHDLSFVPPREFLEREVSFPLPPGLGRATAFPADREVYRLERRVELYDAELRWVDLQVERLLEALADLGALEDTLVCVLADHGEAFGERGFWSHGQLYEEQIRVPWILAGPGLPGGRVVAERVRLVDLLPTLAELMELGAVTGMVDGVSLLRAIAGRPLEGAPLDVYAEVHHADGDHRERAQVMHALTVGPWKVVGYPRGDFEGRPRLELYNLERDPGETDDRSASEARVAELLSGRLAELDVPAGEVPSPEGLDEELRRMLAELGYLSEGADGEERRED